MSVAARRIRAGDVLLASGSLLLLVAILVHVRAVKAAPSPGPGPRGSVVVSEGAPDGAPRVPIETAAAEPAAMPAVPGAYEPPTYVPNSRSIREWKDLPVHVIHRPHWISGREHPKGARGTGIDYQLRSAELHLEVLGFDPDSIRHGFAMVNRIDTGLLAAPAGGDATQRLLQLARGGPETEEFAATAGADGGEEAVRVRAIAMLAGRGDSGTVDPALRRLAKEDASPSIRTAAGISLLWRGRQGEVAEWVASEPSSRAVSDFFDSVQQGGHKLLEPHPPRTLIFESVRAVESTALVDALMEGTGPARWEAPVRAKMYGVAALYGGERAEVGRWMEREYARATEDLVRASILFSAPDIVHARGLEDRAIDVARAGGSGYLVRTALFSLGRFRTERSLRALMEVVPTCGDDTAGHAVRALAELEPWFGNEIAPFLRNLAAGHPNPVVREEASAALRRTFGSYPR